MTYRYFVVEAYNKDNDTYEALKVVDHYSDAELLAKAFTELIKKDMLVSWHFDEVKQENHAEPFDSVEVRYVTQDENGEKQFKIMVNDEQTDEYEDFFIRYQADMEQWIEEERQNKQ